MAADSFIRTDAEQNRIQSFAFVISVCLAVCLSVGFAASGLVRFGIAFDSCKIELDERINPNDAPPASLVRLPGIGVSRAVAIVAYREDFSRQNGNTQAFQNCDDLQKVKGIGPKTAQNISGWLKFE
jgi:competence ComEA-like helix-hairpin-helix protein